MIVGDTSALISLASIDLLDTFLVEFDVHTTAQVVEKVTDTAEHDDSHGDAARIVLESLDRIPTHQVQTEFTSSRVDAGEGSCVVLTRQRDAAFLITDDLRSLPELRTLADATVAISPTVLKALVERTVLERADAVELLDELADQRDWLGAPIYRRAQELFE